ncbi:unnamed protein product, partial [Ascophyllum nodosum]
PCGGHGLPARDPLPLPSGHGSHAHHTGARRGVPLSARQGRVRLLLSVGRFWK